MVVEESNARAPTQASLASWSTSAGQAYLSDPLSVSTPTPKEYKAHRLIHRGNIHGNRGLKRRDMLENCPEEPEHIETELLETWMIVVVASAEVDDQMD